MSNSIIEKYNKPFEYAGIVMYLLIAYQFLDLWLHPEQDDASRIYSMAILMGFEFVMVHSGVFMAVMPKKTSLLVLIPFYGLFAWGFTSFLGNFDIIHIYMIVVFNRMRFAFSDVSAEIKNKAIIMSIIAAIIYFILIFICVFANGVFGEQGLTEEFLKSTTYFDDLKTGGEFIERPHTALSFGVFYYCALALFSSLLLRKTFTKQELIEIQSQ